MSANENTEEFQSVKSLQILETIQENEQEAETPLTDLINEVNTIKANIHYLKLENDLLYKILEECSPQSLAIMEKWLQNARGPTRDPGRASFCPSIISAFQPIPTPSIKSATPEVFGISLTHKWDLVTKELETFDAKLKDLYGQHHKREMLLLSEIEELTTREQELQTTMDEFHALVHANEELGLPLVKYVQFMLQWQRKARYAVDKLRLRTDSLKVEFNKISNLYTQKQMIGENLQRVDFEQLEIENKHLLEQIERQNQRYMNLKKMTCKANLQVTQNKVKLEKKLALERKTRDIVKHKNELVEKASDDLDATYEELDRVEEEKTRIYKKLHGLKAPDLMDYIRLKAQSDNLRKELKVWHRRRQLQKMAIATCLNRIKAATGLKELNLKYIV